MGLKAGWVDVPVRALVKADWNYKEDDPGKAEKLAANIKRNGQLETIIIRDIGKGKFEVVNGNHRHDAFILNKVDTAHAFNLGKVSDAAARRIAIETNETRFRSNDLKMAQLIVDLQAEFSLPDLVSTLPYTETEVQDFISLTTFDFDQLPKPPVGGAVHGSELSFTLDENQQALWSQAMEKWSKQGVVDPVEVLMKCVEASLASE